MVEGNSSDWTRQEIEKIVIWLEDAANLRRTQKGSGETKKRWMNALASTISSRSEAQVGYKFDNLKKSYREALRLADQSGWGLDEEDLRMRSSLHGKLEKKCPFFSRLDTIWGTRPNFRPPSLFSSSAHSQETGTAATALIDRLIAGSNTIQIDDTGDNEQQQNTLSQPSSAIPTSIQNRESTSEDLIQITSYPSPIPETPSENSLHHGYQPFEPHSPKYQLLHPSTEPVSPTPGYPPPTAECYPSTSNHPSPTADRQQPNPERPPLSPEHETAKSKLKRKFPVAEEADEDGRMLKKKKGSASLGDAIAVMADKKYDFLEKQLVQQSELRKEELELEKKRVEIRERELELEHRRWDVLMEKMIGLREGQGGHQRS